jgi:hypothetical protein
MAVMIDVMPRVLVLNVNENGFQDFVDARFEKVAVPRDYGQRTEPRSDF